MNIWQFMSDSPWIAGICLFIICGFFVKLINRIMRHWNIRKHGYPPSHCDADGDFRDENKEDD